MSRIRAKDTKPEIVVRKFLYANGYRYRIHYSKLPGKPDIVLIGKKIIIDVKGCFWHRHSGCKYAAIPKTNYEFYQKKFSQTIERDTRNRRVWLLNGWKVIDIWECEVKNSREREHRLESLIQEINS